MNADLGGFSNSASAAGPSFAAQFAYIPHNDQVFDLRDRNVEFNTEFTLNLRLDADSHTGDSRYDLDFMMFLYPGMVYNRRSGEGIDLDPRELGRLQSELAQENGRYEAAAQIVAAYERRELALYMRVAAGLDALSRDWRERSEPSLWWLLSPEVRYEQECAILYGTSSRRAACFDFLSADPLVTQYREVHRQYRAALSVAQAHSNRVREMVENIAQLREGFHYPTRNSPPRAARPNSYLRIGLGLAIGYALHHNSWTGVEQSNVQMVLGTIDFHRAFAVGGSTVDICLRASPLSVVMGRNQIGTTQSFGMYRSVGIACLGVTVGRMGILRDQLGVEYLVGNGSILNVSNFIGLEHIGGSAIGAGYRYEFDSVRDGAGNGQELNSHFGVLRGQW